MFTEFLKKVWSLIIDTIILIKIKLKLMTFNNVAKHTIEFSTKALSLQYLTDKNLLMEPLDDNKQSGITKLEFRFTFPNGKSEHSIGASIEFLKDNEGHHYKDWDSVILVKGMNGSKTDAALQELGRLKEEIIGKLFEGYKNLY